MSGVDEPSGPELGEGPHPVGQLQKRYGNQAAQWLVKERIQPKLEVGPPNDRYEREAEQVARAVTREPNPTPQHTGHTTGPTERIQRMCPRCQKRHAAGKPLDCPDCEPQLRRAATTATTSAVDTETASLIHVSRNGGQPLPDSARSYFEPRFGHEFGDVRVHTDSRADEAARAVNAQAFTLGRDIVFRSGAYRPEAATGKRLLAHELTHVVQQHRDLLTTNSRGTTEDSSLERDSERASQHVLSPSTRVDVSEVAPVSIQREGPTTEEALKEVNRKVLAAVKPTITGLRFKRTWPGIERQIKNPVATKPKKGPMTQYPHLFAEPLVTELKTLTAAQREAIAVDVKGKLATKITGQSPAELKKEHASLSTFVRDNIEKEYPGYVSVRAGLLNTFGSLKKANKYYRSLVSADFPSSSSSVLGAKRKVHPKLRDRLKAARTVLESRTVGDKTWLDIVESGIKRVGGFNIRENRNNTSKLSTHSFGWAIDIDAELNPNVEAKNFPNQLVEGFTGEDVYGGPAATAFRSGGTVEELLPHARTLRSASDEFKRAFEDETELKKAMKRYLKRQGLVIDDTQASELFNLIKTGKKKKKKKEISKWLSNAKAEAGTTAVWSEAAKVAQFLIDAYRVFKRTTRKGTKIKPKSLGTPKTLAAHGFVNIPAELIAALTGSDGGNLKWLGAVKSGNAKDFMHFELKRADRPTIPKATAPATAPASGGAKTK